MNGFSCSKSSCQSLRVLWAVGITMLFLALACASPLDGEDSLLEETRAALDIKATLDDERAATLYAQQTDMIVQVTRQAEDAQQGAVGSTVQAQQATMAAQQTLLAQPTAGSIVSTPVSSADTPTPPPAAQTGLDPIVITNWKMSGWVEAQSGCYVEDKPCWKMVDGKYEDTYLVSRESVKIESGWPRPYLVFWHKPGLLNSANLSILGGPTGGGVVNYSERRGSWRRDTIDLSAYKGESITLQFYAAVWYGYNSWLVQDVQIVPNFTSQ